MKTKKLQFIKMSRRQYTNILSYSGERYSESFENESKSEDQYFYSKGSNKILINVSGKGIEVDMDIFRSVIEKLKKYSSSLVSDLNEEISDNYNTVVSFINIASSDDHVYERFVKIIREIFGDVKNIKPGTIGSYFLGNIQNFEKTYNSYQGPANCHPLKIGAAPNIRGQSNDCQYPAFIFSHGKFTRQNNINGAVAVIYVDRPSFSGFTAQNIIDLQSIGISSAYLNYGINSDEAIESSPHPINIQSLPMKMKSNEQKDFNTSEGINGYILFLLIILIVLVVFVGFLFIRKSSSKQDIENMNKIEEKNVKMYNRNYVSSSPRFGDRYDFLRNRPSFKK